MSAAGPIAAVGGDTFGGKTGFKRPLQGNPTRVPGSLPAFRGAKNKPGDTIHAPGIKSSSNRPTRGTNETVRYSRLTKMDHTNHLGRLDPGDVAFISRGNVYDPGYAQSQYVRLMGVDKLNHFLSARYWNSTDASGNYRFISVAPANIADDWRAVPFLSEWVCDGVVMSSEAPEINRSSGELDNQMYNMALQGICPINNGYVTQEGLGMLSRNVDMYKPGDYSGAKYHLYPLQMFDRGINPLNELFVGLVATPNEAPDLANLQLFAVETKTFKDLENRRAFLVDELQRASGNEFATLNRQVAEMQSLMEKAQKRINGFAKRTLYEGWKEAGWWDGTEAGAAPDRLGGPKYANGTPAKFYSFRYVFFSSRQAMEINTYDAQTNPAGVQIFQPQAQSNARPIYRTNADTDPFDNFEARKYDFKRMVGAWRVGKVTDVKAAKMPWFPSGPSETGYRVTVNVNIEWWDYRKLRRTYTPTFDNAIGKQANQFGAALGGVDTGPWTDPYFLNNASAADLVKLTGISRDAGRVLQWPTFYDPKMDNYLFAAGGTQPADAAAADEEFKNNPNIPINPELYYDQGDMLQAGNAVDYGRKRNRALGPARGALVNAGTRRPGPGIGEDLGDDGEFMELVAPVPDAPVEDHLAFLRRSTSLVADDRASNFGAVVDHMDTTLNAMQAHMDQLNRASGASGTGGGAASGSRPGSSRTPTRTAAATAATASAVVAPVTTAAPMAPMAPPPAPPSAPPQPTAPTAAAAEPAAADVAPSPSRSTRRARSAVQSADVFSSIFGGGSSSDAGSSATQPLNPSHRVSPGGGGATGRSFAKRKSGAKEGSLDK